MAEQRPIISVIKETNDTAQLLSPADQLKGDVLPKLSYLGMLGLKTALIAPVIGGMAVAAPLAASSLFITAAWQRKKQNRQYQKEIIHDRAHCFTRYDFSKNADRKRFQDDFSKAQPTLVDSYIQMAESAKLKTLPELLVFKKYRPQAPRLRDYSVSTAASPQGREPVVMIGQAAIHQLDSEECRAVLGHEFSHLALRHVQKRQTWRTLKATNKLLNIGILAAASIATLTTSGFVLPAAAAFVITTHYAGKALEMASLRQHEKSADRGAALITGATQALISGIAKIGQGQLAVLRRQQQQSTRRKIRKTPKTPGALTRLFYTDHPSRKTREGLMKKFNSAHPAYCAKRRASFSPIFQKISMPRQTDIPRNTKSQAAAFNLKQLGQA